ncbi:3-ketodihydrosphingosine reductase [Komagataeibacter rhaeticus]|uniref:SDR family oxidoreductase n=1 Tax=Komagataeibacter rhaeticus TaxID=215221 RepID=A0A858JKS1_9PROT|nr:SDR family NAD(P)-dependent oxidoreductase [Komagataeibacter rhaeticus]ATU73746.1 3-ketodihydrosphingosine reductase [Komagataeibacter xylinus]MBL7239833.1 SDR family NAD(P)-dependent oxidoreductase [Komagataeibacter rhaeticus]PYD55163.1 3-ketodihydrosphingosine reductase [Komagataeibacter rhaeticus]QIP34358.1 SDR family oxidoreductase [Komagataeibacter rhaeticus]QOC46870.1 SDR family NAD(P)-dependent oxidoreductase [Komagataeibacter rhaeticus]
MENSDLNDRPGRVAVVTGATGGIGRALVRRMLGCGYRVIILSRQGTVDLPAVTIVPCDLTDGNSIRAAAPVIASHAPAIDVLVHCAGVITPQSVGELDSAVTADQIAVDLVAPIELTNALLPTMRDGGHIVFVNSMAAVFPLAGSSVYTAAKFGLRGFARALEQELRPRRIQVSSLYPASVNTPMLSREMNAGGSIYNFIDPPQEPDVTARRILECCKHRSRERFSSVFDKLFTHACLASMPLLNLSLPIMKMLGRRGYRAYLRRLSPPRR